ncbi:NAD(P)-dependent oxidoreductase [Gilvimarinus sp. 1_MG-2023]|uniref:NAD(P)-dependent oxidoreductase n=1 Tax=Gilvimarinus sp. 1_MG-2023 TaxID=3062638 RepID=UPI0026E42F75|nr:NAD(P)-dependent oxidoreductase [Gilvimarinus sp. 1_MG-2023]MDO6746599.1 NAD(P)-dependent oxidoreductase [Gilvimarinus sp. 1_MG-2023]
MFKKLVGIEPLSLVPEFEKQLYDLAEEVVLYDDRPKSPDEIAKRIGDADAVMLSHTTDLGKEALSQCNNIQYIGMCCSLYSPKSANVDIKYANERGITVKGVRDYGDEGVVEYVVSELVRCLHGFGEDDNGKPVQPWDGVPREITDLKVGIVGLGTLGEMIADALTMFGAEITYFSRSEKAHAAKKGYHFLPLKELLAQNEVVVCCLNKNVVLLNDEEFTSFGNGKILFNVGLSPAWQEAPFAEWIKDSSNACYCDSYGALGNEKYLEYPNVHSVNICTGRTRQAFRRLSEKVINNIKAHLA